MSALNAEKSTEIAMVSGELLIELPRNSGNEGRGDEHCGQNERDRNYRSRNLLHRLDGGVVRRQPKLDVVFHSLHHHNRVVNDQSNRKDEPEKRQRIDREPKYRKDHEGSHQRDRNREQRNQRCPPAL